MNLFLAQWAVRLVRDWLVGLSPTPITERASTSRYSRRKNDKTGVVCCFERRVAITRERLDGVARSYLTSCDCVHSALSRALVCIRNGVVSLLRREMESPAEGQVALPAHVTHNAGPACVRSSSHQLQQMRRRIHAIQVRSAFQGAVTGPTAHTLSPQSCQSSYARHRALVTLNTCCH